MKRAVLNFLAMWAMFTIQAVLMVGGVFLVNHYVPVFGVWFIPIGVWLVISASVAWMHAMVYIMVHHWPKTLS